MKVSIIAALDEQGVIGSKGDLPWRLPEDQKFFRRVTTGHTLVMGRATYESIGRPLPGRTTIVLSRRRDFAPEGVDVVGDFDTALEAARSSGAAEVFVAGGAAVYAAALPAADRLYLTRVHTRVEGDTFFPEWDRSTWRLVKSTPHAADDRHPFDFTIHEYVRAD